MRSLGKIFLTVILFAALNRHEGNGYYAVDERKYEGTKRQYESSASVTESGKPASAWAQELLADNNYGKPVEYSAGWYNNLSDVEKIARTIYSEGGTGFADEEDGVASVILNRAYVYSQSVQAVVLGNNQFAALTGDAAQSRYAREPAVNTPKWEHSTYLACLLLTITNRQEWDALIGNPVGNRLCFSSYSCAKNSGGGAFRDNALTGNIEYCDGGTWKPVKNVYVIGYGDVSSVNSLFSSAVVPDDYSRNIYYEYQ